MNQQGRSLEEERPVLLGSFIGMVFFLCFKHRLAKLFQDRYVFCNDFPCCIWVNFTISMSNDVSHRFDLPPGDSWVLDTETLREIAYQFSDLKDTQRCRIAVDWVLLKNP